MSRPIVVGSRSPRRQELLQTLIEPSRLIVLPPLSAEEPGFENLQTPSEFEARILEIVACKREDVAEQIRQGAVPGIHQSGERRESEPESSAAWQRDDPAARQSRPPPPNDGCLLICADTTVIVKDATGRSLSLGQPPEGDEWPDVVRRWFREYLAGQTHTVLSGVSVTEFASNGEELRTLTRTSSTQVTMRSDVEEFLDWYISTGEPPGKAGGYAIQGAGSVFVTKFEGSFSNVVGLPLEVTIEMLREVGVTEPSSPAHGPT